MHTVDVQLLGAFAVTVDGRPLGSAAFPQRRAADLVKLLALAGGRRLPRDAVVEALWPHLGAEAGLANLHKAAHHARRALGEPRAIVLRRGAVELAPGATVTTDVERFEAGDDAAYAGELLPDDRYETWTLAARDRLRERRLEVLRRQARWAELVDEEPADEEAHRALMREHAARGDRAAAALQFRALADALARLGLQPAAETVALQRALCAGPAVQVRPHRAGALTGRDDELATASRALAAAGDGQGGCLLVVGDAGTGKSRLVDAVLAAAAQRDRHVLRAAAHDPEGGLPYRPLADALEPLLAERPDLLAALAPAAQRVLALLCPAAVRGVEVARGARGQDVLAAVDQLLAAAAAERPLVLAIEDLHEADAATLRALRYVVASARRRPALVVLSLRPDEGPGEAGALRRRLLEQRAATEIHLGPLAAGPLRRIARRAAPRPLDDATLDAVVEAAAGNPFYAEELAAAGPAGAAAPPTRLEALLSARVDRLAAVAPGVLPVVAVLDDGAGTDEIAELADVGREAAHRELLAGVRTGVLRAAGGGWRFRHPLLRAAAQRRLIPDELAAAHRRAAEHLDRRGAAPERVAGHLLAGGRERQAVPLLRRAAEAAAELGAFADGIEWVRLALTHAEAADRPTLLELLGDLRHGAGDARAASAYAAARGERRGAAVAGLQLKEARAHVALGDLAGAQRAIEGLDGEGHAHARESLLVRGMIAWYRGDFATARRCADAAAEEPGGDAAGDAVLYDLQAMIAHAEGRWERAMEAQLAEVWHVPQLAGRVLDAYLCVTEYVLHAGDPAARLMQFARDLRAQADAAGARRGIAFAATVLGEAHLLAGEPEAAAEHLADAVRLSRAVGAVGGESLARTRLGEALAVLGRRAESRAHLDEAVELAHASSLADHVLFIAHAPLVRVAEDPEEALLVVDRAEALLDPEPACRFCPVEYYVAAATACARAGDVGRGRGFLDRARASAALWAGGPRSAAVAEAHGELLLAEGRDADAEVAFLRAADGYASVGHRLHEDRVRDLLAARV
ncbi:MAG TPA: AAA family ATPase [Baekduia sp.]|nr:AAA family ATPase [Baekduia sp.]